MPDLHNQCGACPEEGIVRINERWWCVNHLDQGFREALEPLRVFLDLDALGDTGS